MGMFDDGAPLQDDQGETLVPFEPENSYEEKEAIYLCAFAGSYREVRGALQATRMGRDQKMFHDKTKGAGRGSGRKGAGRGFKKKPFIRSGQPPKRPNSGVRAPFKDKAGGKASRGPASELLKCTRCFRCGKLGHVSRHCKSGAAGPAGGSRVFFRRRQ